VVSTCFNLFEKYVSKWESSPSRGETKKYLSCHHLELHLSPFKLSLDLTSFMKESTGLLSDERVFLLKMDKKLILPILPQNNTCF